MTATDLPAAGADGDSEPERSPRRRRAPSSPPPADPATEPVPPPRGEGAPHPAKFGPGVLATIRGILHDVDPDHALRVLDPFGGIGGVHALAHPLAGLAGGERCTIATELEPEWARQGLPRAAVADATALPFPAASFDAVVTSPTYGNRLADGYDGAGVCRKCNGTGTVGMLADPQAPDGRCVRCGGAGHDTSTRLTYRLKLGRPLTWGNSGAMAWGPEYRRVHRRAWAEVRRVLIPDGLLVLNVKDHDRTQTERGVSVQVRQRVTLWHHVTLEGLGFERIGGAVPDDDAQGYGHGRNREARYSELVLVYRSPVAPS